MKEQAGSRTVAVEDQEAAVDPAVTVTQDGEEAVGERDEGSRSTRRASGSALRSPHPLETIYYRSQKTVTLQGKYFYFLLSHDYYKTFYLI